MRVPATGEPFRWRVSVAHIDASGPFSDFAAYHRKMVLLRGAGIDLRFADGTRKSLLHVGELVEFDGAVPTYGELLNGPCVDLNLMILKSERAAVRVERLSESLAVGTRRGETTLVFPIDSRLALRIETGETALLEPWDLAVLTQCLGRIDRLESMQPAAASVFLATLKFMGGE